MNIWYIISAALMVFVTMMAVRGAIKSKEGVIGVVANLSMPALMFTIIAAFLLPQYPGLAWQEMIMLAVVISMAGIAVWSNNKHGNIIIKRLKDRMPR